MSVSDCWESLFIDTVFVLGSSSALNLIFNLRLAIAIGFLIFGLSAILSLTQEM